MLAVIICISLAIVFVIIRICIDRQMWSVFFSKCTFKPYFLFEIRENTLFFSQHLLRISIARSRYEYLKKHGIPIRCFGKISSPTNIRIIFSYTSQNEFILLTIQKSHGMYKEKIHFCSHQSNLTKLNTYVINVPTQYNMTWKDFLPSDRESLTFQKHRILFDREKRVLTVYPIDTKILENYFIEGQ